MKNLLFLLLFIPLFSNAQKVKYNSVIKVNGNELEMYFYLELKDEWTGKLDIPAQGAKGLDLKDIVSSKDSVIFTIDGVPGDATVRSAVRGDSLVGDFHQAGAVFPFFGAIEDNKEAVLANMEQLRMLIDSLRDTLRVPGCAVGMYYKGDIILNTGFGLRDVKNNKPVDENTIFAIGSSSKAFTATMLAEAIARDSIEWDEPVAPLIPGFGMKDPFANNQLNAIDLLTHRSGLPRHDLLWYGTKSTRQELIEKIKDLEPSEPFRTVFQYQNLMYMTAGVLVGNIYNSTWEEQLQKQIFDPLGMMSSGYTLNTMEGKPNAALPYDKRDGVIKQIPYRNIDVVGPAGSINSNSTDMLKWIGMYLNNGKVNDEQVFNEDVIKRAMRPYLTMSSTMAHKDLTPFTYGLGWFINYYKGHKIVKHGGNIDGFSALVFMMPEDDFGLVVLTNKNATTLGELIAMYAADKILELDDIDWFDVMYPEGYKHDDEDDEEENDPSVDKPAGPYHELSEYAGKYKNDVYGTVTISQNKDGLVMKTDAFEFEMKHYTQEIFAIRDVMGGSWDKIVFRSDLTGNIAYFEYIVEASLDPYKFERQADDKFKQTAYLEEFEGTYKMEGLSIVVKADKDKLTAEVTGQGKFNLVPTSENFFDLEGVKGYKMEFVRNKKGKVTHMMSHQPNGDFKAEKTESSDK